MKNGEKLAYKNFHMQWAYFLNKSFSISVYILNTSDLFQPPYMFNKYTAMKKIWICYIFILCLLEINYKINLLKKFDVFYLNL